MPLLAEKAQSDLFTLSNEDWTAINKRVGSALLARPIAGYVQQYIKTYPELLITCDLWCSSTFDALITQSASITAYSRDADTSFSDLLLKVEPYIKGTDPVPPALQTETIDKLKALLIQTSPLSTALTASTTSTRQFVNANAEVDGQIAKNREQLGTFWTPLGAVIASTDTAVGKLASAWSAISDDLKNTLGSPITVDSAFLELLNLKAAISLWRNLNAEASAFGVIAPAQKVFWTNPF